MCTHARRRIVLVALVALACGGAVPLLTAAQAPAALRDDPLLGSWDLDLGRSKYTASPRPKSQTRTYEAHPQGVKTTIRTVYEDGQSNSIQYVAGDDGIEYPVTGSTETDAIVLKKLNAFTAEAVLSHAGKVMLNARRVISEDGRTLTITLREPNGVVRSVAVYTKQSR